MSVPWIVHNYRLTGELIPTSTHGGVQLWYGTLQTGAYLDSRAHNPRSFFEAPAFDYTSLAGQPLVISASRPCEDQSRAQLWFWTDRDPTRRPASRVADVDGDIAFTIPGQPNPTAVYYYFTVPRPDGAETKTPPLGAGNPFVFFVDDRDLEDLDRHDDLIDAFDVIRVVHDEQAGDEAVRSVVAALLPDAPQPIVVDRRGSAAVLRFGDGSTLTVPRAWSGRITDVAVTPGAAPRLLYERRSHRAPTRAEDHSDRCRTLERVRVNDVFYRREPHMQRRYLALAWDNIRRDPAAYLAGAGYRAVRLFVVQGTSDANTAWQFSGSGAIYALATIASILYVVFAAAGVAIAVRRRCRVWLLLTPILYIPATICFVLTNMRYTITVQPLLLAFGALAITAPARDAARADTQTTSPLS